MGEQLFGDRYRLVRQLGEGGMGQVWEARDERLGRAVAVKVITSLAGGVSHSGDARERFLREARITAQLQHPSIVTIHDLGESGPENDEVPFLVMELVRGEGLDAIVRRGAVPLADAARWGVRICEALAEAHNAGIMHRDIKPSNVLITPSGAVKVLDFGIARTADASATADRLTQTGFIVGTPPYMAPEQARGFPEPRSDLYALGCLLFELITGRLPFQATDAVGYLTAHLTQEPPAPGSVAAGIPPAWDDLVLTLLHKDPAQRYPNAGDLAEALRRLGPSLVPAPLPHRGTDLPTTPATPPLRPAPTAPRAQTAASPRRRGVTPGRASTVALVAVVLAIALGFGYIGMYTFVIGGDLKDAQAGDCLWFDTEADRAKYGYGYQDVAKTEPCALPFRMFGNRHYVVVERIDRTSDYAQCGRVPGAVVDADTSILKSTSPPYWVLCVRSV
ncbi:serine/threonine-protein kinase [Kitasatospora sp. NPDC087314]|uniref:serine/threonine-protein kinase n=1 Tax=Kitasatospora sp. NPDC087314 TaxID=3364068 RepID=UPI0038080496